MSGEGGCYLEVWANRRRLVARVREASGGYPMIPSWG